jgi:hypothetical protein
MVLQLMKLESEQDYIDSLSKKISGSVQRTRTAGIEKENCIYKK